MNLDEAKVPNVEKDWKSIEIFLFSNGQQYSPPRKYLLRVDELNLWDATLNQLAQSHYGAQSPFIHLYTTNGDLVKGPLDLRDGQAYVAVAPPDTFVDAGYQKYLIRASRSWEKRQARMKPQECVPGEPCCLCPERERSCCDPQACCLCPEREDADSLEVLLPATGHPELRPAGSHYMSSAPPKPVADDDYEPVSGKIDRMSCKHCENRANLREYGYSPVPTTDNPNGYSSRPDEYAARPAENETRPSVYGAMPNGFGARPAEYGARHGEYETRPSKNGAKSGEYGAELCEHGARPSINGGRPAAFGARAAEYETRLGENNTKPTVNKVKPVEYGATQGEYETRLTVNGAKPGEHGAGPGDETKRVYETKLGEYGARPSLNGVKPGEHGARPGEYETRPSLNEDRPGEFASSPAEYGAGPGDETKPSVNGTILSEYGARPSLNGVKPGEYGATPGEYETRTSLNARRPGEFGARSAEYGAGPGDETKPSVNGTKLSEYGARPSLNGVTPGEYGATPGEYETRTSLNARRPGEFGARSAEYGAGPGDETQPSVNGTKLSEYGARPSLNGVTPGEYGARPSEYETRTSLNGRRPGEFRARPAEYGAGPGDETKPNVNGTKLGEYGARPSLNGVKPGEYGTRPDEYETRTSLNGRRPGELGARPGEYETKPSANEIKPGEYGVRPGGYETRPSLNGAKPGEFVARTAEYGVRPGDHETMSTVNGTKQAEYETSVNSTSHAKYENEYRPSPAKFETIASVNGANLGEYGMRRDENKTKPSVNGINLDEFGTKLAKYETKPRVNGANPGEHGARQGEYKTKLIGNEPKPYDFLARPGEYATRSAEQENRPDEYVPRPVKHGSWSGEYGDRTTSHKARPGHSGPRSGKIDPIKEAYEIALREKEKSLKENEDIPDKNTVIKDASIECTSEYTTREIDYRDKQNEPKDWSRGNAERGGERGVSGGEKNIGEKDTVTGVGESKARKNENARRLSARGGAEIEVGAKTGEPTRGFEHGGRVSIQKARETNTAGRVSGQGARLNEQKNKQSNNLAKLGGRETRVGDHEARAGDMGFQNSGHDAGLENTGSREAEPGARATVSGFRGSPRDRVSSRAKTGQLGQPRIGKPGNKIDEASVRLDDLDIKHRENPGARQNRVGATGTAGVLNISEAQQHARRNALSTGRPSIEKKRLSIAQNSSLPKRLHPNSSILRKPEDRQPIKNNKENLPKKMNEKASPNLVPASNDNGKSKTEPQCIAPPVLLPSTISITNIATVTTDKNPLDYEKEIAIVSTHSIKDPESETKPMMDSVKHIVGAINSSQEETQTEPIYIEKSTAYTSVNKGVQTDTEEVEKQGQEVPTSKEKDDSCTRSLCRQPNHKSSDPDENTLSILNKGGVVNIKLNIEVRNIVKSVYSCHKNCGRSQSLTNVPKPEKTSDLSIEDNVVLNHTSLQSLFTKQNFGGFGFDGSPKVMVVQCEGCGRLNINPPQCDPPPCCDNNNKYFVLLNSVLEDKEDGWNNSFYAKSNKPSCNFNPPCRPCDERQSKRQSSGIPIKQAFSETTLDTITTVTVSGVPLQRREMGKCATNTSCQTEEPQNECMTTKRKVSITQDSVSKFDLQKKSNSSDCVATQAVILLPKQSCLKMYSQKFEYEDSQICSELCRAARPPTCEKVRSVCSHVHPQAYENVQPNCSQVPPSTCEPVQPNCSQVPPPTCEKVGPGGSEVSPPACENVQSDCSQMPPSTYEQVRSVCSHVRPPTCENMQPNSSQVPPSTYEQLRSVCSHVRPPTYENVQPNCSQEPPPTCEKVRPVCSQELLPICEKVRSVCLQVSPPTCEKVRSLCAQVSSQTFSQVQTKGCQSLGPQNQSQGCMPVSTTRRPCCSKLPPQVQHCNAETQTRWASILARLHCDGRYSFHLPPLHVLKNNCHSYCQ